MNFRKFRKNAKALSPVVASIILIAVTVAVSIAVAAWMGGMSIGFMQTEQLTITNAQFVNSGANITLSVRNSGSSDVTINTATVNGGATATMYDSTGAVNTSIIIGKNTATTITVSAAWVSGNSYQIKLVSSKGTNFLYTAVAS
jgi:archaeal type IV pilus assembly protein PilA